MKYQIKRCTAPCVGKISPQDYKSQVDSAINFLKGKTSDIQKDLARKMQKYSDDLDFENAAKMRDKISALAKIQMSDNIALLDSDNMDILGIFVLSNTLCIQIFFIRSGYNYGNIPYFFQLDGGYDENEMIYQFVHQFYIKNQAPKMVVLSRDFNHSESLEKILKTEIYINPQDQRLQKILDFANKNATNSVKRKLASNGFHESIAQEIKVKFDLQKEPYKIEVFDNSHIFGQNAVGAMIAVNKDGFDKSSYRKFNFGSDVNQMDDYEMMTNMLSRRAEQIKDIIAAGNLDKIPDLWLVDGGAGHVGVVKKVLEDSGLDLPFICVSKGVDRNAGNELFHTHRDVNIKIDRESELMYFFQRIRDEAHRFAITSHRKKRDKDSIKSILDEIPGIGASRRKAVLSHFGSVKLIKEASLSDLEKVEGVSKKMAEIIYNYFHGEIS